METIDHPEKEQETPANQKNYAPVAFDTATMWKKSRVCCMGAQVENVLKYNKENSVQAQKNMDNVKAALNPATIKKMQIRFPEEFKDIEADSQ